MIKQELRERIFEILDDSELLTTEELAETLATEIVKLDMEAMFDEETEDEQDDMG